MEKLTNNEMMNVSGGMSCGEWNRVIDWLEAHDHYEQAAEVINYNFYGCEVQ